MLLACYIVCPVCYIVHPVCYIVHPVCYIVYPVVSLGLREVVEIVLIIELDEVQHQRPCTVCCGPRISNATVAAQ